MYQPLPPFRPRKTNNDDEDDTEFNPAVAPLVQLWQFCLLFLVIFYYRYLYSIDYGRVLDTLMAHDDAVSALWLKDNLLITASWDSTVKVWLCEGLQTNSGGKMAAELLAELDHDTGVSLRAVSTTLEFRLDGTKINGKNYSAIL